MILFALIGGMILIGLGIVGEYVGKVFEAVQSRPIYIVQQTVNLERIARTGDAS